MDAPLSSPTATQPTQYFTFSNTSSNTSSNTNTHAPQSSASSFPPQQQQQQQYQQPQTQQYQPQTQKHPGAGVAATSPFLRDFNLVAEAAKRAQMAVLMRDMEAVGLT